MISYKAKPTSRKAINDLVRRIRIATGVDDLDYFNIIEFLELKLTKIVKDLAIVVLSKEEMGNVFAKTYPNEKEIHIREDIYRLANEGDGFARITVSHEVGHLFMHKEERVSFCRMSEPLKAYEDPEWQADAFGGELLAPAYRIRNKTVSQIQNDHGLTKSAASTQRKAMLKLK